jgi:muramoyltetrapeptide carboxypeptidase
MTNRQGSKAGRPRGSPITVNKPTALKPGGRIGVLAPAGAVDSASLIAGVEAIKAEGFEVELAAGIYGRKGYLAGDAKSRAQDLIDFFRRDDIHAIFCARGGFGSIQLLPYLNEELRRYPKIFVGYSDITILINWLHRFCSMVTFHAPMVAMDLAKGLNARSRDHFWGVLTGTRRRWRVRLGETIHAGHAEAEMMGGCLSLLVTTLGTAYEIDTRGKILFLEDVGEKPYRVERMLTHLKMAGKLDGVAGIVFGDFTHCDGDGPRDIRQVVHEMFHDAGYPVLMGLAAGHGEENLALPFGVKLSLNGDEGTLALEESPLA